MDLNKYCVKLKSYREQGVRISNFFGKIWFISRLLGIFVSIFFMVLPDRYLNILGYFLVGFIGGSVGVDIRTYIKTTRIWPLQKEVIDWDKVDYLSENISNPY